MAQVDHIKISGTTYDVGYSPNSISTFESSDVADGNATAWTTVSKLESGETNSSIFAKISQMFKNIRFLKRELDGKANATHSHTTTDLPVSSTQVNSSEQIPTSSLVYSMNTTLTSLNDAYLHFCAI